MRIGIEAMHAEKQPRTGVEEYSYQIIEHLKQIIPATVQVVLYSKYPLTGALGVLPAHWTNKVLKWPFQKLWSQIRLSVELLMHPPDVFFAPAQLIPFFTPPKTIVALHDSAFLVYKNAYRFWGRQYLAFMNKRIIKNAHTIVSPSQFTVAELRRLYAGTMLPTLTVTPLAVDETKITVHDACEDVSCFGITRDYIFSAGRLETKKNTLAILEAYTKIREQLDVQLVLAGLPGSGYEAVAAAIAQHPFKRDIILPGYVKSAELSELYEKAKVFIFPSLYEGFGLPILEAMTHGVPVVASAIPVLQEVGGDAARYVSAHDSTAIALSVLSILNNSGEADRLRTLGRARAAQFSWKRTAELTYDAIVKMA